MREPLLSLLFRPKSKRDPRNGRQRVGRCPMNTSDDWRVRCHSRFEVVLGFVVIAVEEIAKPQIQFDTVTELLGERQIEDSTSRGNNGRIVRIQPVMVDGTHL